MKNVGLVLAVLGVLVGVFALADHFALHVINTSHTNLIAGIVGVVLLAAGAGMFAMGGRKA